MCSLSRIISVFLAAGLHQSSKGKGTTKPFAAPCLREFGAEKVLLILGLLSNLIKSIVFVSEPLLALLARA